MQQIDLELLKAHAINKPKEFLYSHPEYSLSVWEKLKLKYFVFLRNRGYSVAAITGHKEFYGLDFLVNKHVLIPRPDTELMVAEAIEEITTAHGGVPLHSGKKSDETILIDVGTSSGCIPISILKNLPTAITAYAVDISRQALKVAKKNARTHNVHIQFFHGNLLQPINKNSIHGAKIIITANLPYLKEEQFQNEPSIQKEPKIALVADNDGLALYEELLQQIKANNINATIFLEIDPSQTEQIKEIIKQHFPSANIEIKKDLAGRDRLVKIN